ARYIVGLGFARRCVKSAIGACERGRTTMDSDGAATGTRARANALAITAICALAAALDGFDLQAAAYAASGVLATWTIGPHLLVLILSSSLLGVFVGAMLIGPLADRFGRKRMVLVSVLLFGGFSCAAALASGPEIFLTFRFFTGVGLGGAMPTLIALVAG